MKHFFHTIPGWFSFATLYREVAARAPPGAVFVEVGSWKGRSTTFMAVEIINNAKPIKFYAVDHWLGSDELAHIADADVKAGTLYDTFLRNIAPVRQNVTPMRMASVEAAKLFKSKSVDFIMLDGGHSYEDVRADIDAWLPKLSEGGVFAGDDYNWSGVRQAIEESFAGRIRVLGEGKGRHWMVLP